MLQALKNIFSTSSTFQEYDLIGRGGKHGQYDGVIIAAFGDPAVEAARQLCPCPVTGEIKAASHLKEIEKHLKILPAVPW